MKKLVFVMLACLMLVAAAACAAPEKEPENTVAVKQEEPESTEVAEPTEDSGEKVKIGLSWFTMSDEHLSKIYTEFEQAVKDQGLENKVELVLLDAGMDAAKQNEQVDNLIAQNVDVIVMIPFDREQQVPAVEAAAEAGIPMIELCASTTAEDVRTSYVGSEDIASGRILMQYLADQAEGKGNIIMIHGPAGQNAEVMRHTGAQEILKKYPDMKVVAEKICDWDRAKAMSAMENVIAADMGVTIVFAEDDGMAMGALEAVEGSGAEGIIIGGIDGIPDALNAVKEGRLVCTVYQNAKEQAIKALEVALKAASGEEVEKLYDVPYELITAENVDNFLK